MDDRAVLVPRGVSCGASDLPRWFELADGIRGPTGPIQSTSEAAEKMADYWLKVAHSGSNPRLCFSEAPSSNESWRFGQGNQDISSAASAQKECLSNLREVSTKKFASASHRWVGWARVDNEVFAIPADRIRKILTLNLATQTLSSLDNVRMASYGRDVAQFPAVVNKCIFAPPWDGDYILVVNASSRRVSTLKHPFFMKGTIETQYSGMVADGTMLYLTPRSPEGSLLLVDVGVNPPTVRGIPLQGSQWWHGSYSMSMWSMWSSSVIADGFLYACPSDADVMLTFDLKHELFGDIDVRAVAEGPEKWGGMIEAEGKLYAAPEDVDQILLVDLRMRKASGIKAWKGFRAVARHGTHLYFVPGNGEELMLLHLETHQINRFRGIVRSEKVGIHAQHFSAAVVAYDRLFALPDQDNEVMSIDLKAKEIALADTDAKTK